VVVVVAVRKTQQPKGSSLWLFHYIMPKKKHPKPEQPKQDPKDAPIGLTANELYEIEVANAFKKLKAGKRLDERERDLVQGKRQALPAAEKEQLFAVNALSEMLHIDRRTLKKYLAGISPAKTQKGSKLYRIDDVRAVLENRVDEFTELRAEQIRQQTRESKERADLLAMERSQLSGTLVPMSEVQEMYSVTLLPIRQAFLSLPSECSSKTNPTDPRFAQSALQTWVDSRALPMIREQLPKPAAAAKVKDL
jgi:hypothetical protein